MLKGGDILKQVKVSVDHSHELQKGYLVDEKTVIYYLDGELNLLGVKTSNIDGIYLQDTAHVSLGKVRNNFPSTIKEIIDKLSGISFWEYLLNYHDRTEDIHFDKLLDQIK